MDSIPAAKRHPAAQKGGGTPGSQLEPALVYVVDDDASLRSALGDLFRSVGLECACCASAAEFLAQTLPDRPGCLVIDVRMPGMSGLEFQAQLSGFGIELPVIIITGYADIPMSVHAMKAGAVDFLPKPFRDQDVLDAVADAIERDRERRQAAGMLAVLRGRYAALSPREQQVVALVVAGRMNKQIASDLSLSEITVKIHRGSVMRKMAAKSLADLVRMAEMLKIGV